MTPRTGAALAEQGFPAHWVTRGHWDSKAKPLVILRQGQAHGPVAHNGQAPPHSGQMGGQLQPCIQVTAFSLLVSSPQGHRLLRARRPVSRVSWPQLREERGGRVRAARVGCAALSSLADTETCLASGPGRVPHDRAAPLAPKGQLPDPYTCPLIPF